MPRSLVGATTLALIAVTSTPASAVSDAVKIACRNDYFAYCSQHDPDGQDVDRLHRRNDPRGRLDEQTGPRARQPVAKNLQ